MKFIYTVAIVLLCYSANAQVFKSSASKISFFSDAPLEDIYAESVKSTAVIDAAKKELAVLMKPNTFVFKNPMMQEHFNEDYLETQKFPKATFSGKILGEFDVTKDGVYDVTVDGKLTLHGVEKARQIKGQIKVVNGKVSLHAKFAISVADHNVKIPSIHIKNIAEIVEVTVDADFKALK